MKTYYSLDDIKAMAMNYLILKDGVIEEIDYHEICGLIRFIENAEKAKEGNNDK